LPKLLRVVEEELLMKCQETLLNKEGSGCMSLLANDKFEDLKRMFNLFNRLEDGLQPMADLFARFVEKQGMELIDKREKRLEDEKAKVSERYTWLHPLHPLLNKPNNTLHCSERRPGVHQIFDLVAQEVQRRGQRTLRQVAVLPDSHNEELPGHRQQECWRVFQR